ncbi:MAG: GNAT family N-acetyltransferase [Gemmatimonadota bacterium]|nr:GNAT family N-acetyltransferase [Gemmatimonadota bacterium]MDE3127855.1 GNAT family N-acetyltransferase [Gemmatimonadota bacterium]MDE3172404.1 GNAT family N-acetyltransferase [Gemmatimonadota bacterium]MDE3216164.1 GNAT family N-acetyltransferase [Gemmatimonadota bacterium]
MAVSRSWKSGPGLDGPFPATVDDIAGLNQVFSDAFTERYRRDGMVGVRVPFLNPTVWRYAIEDAAGGALCWRAGHGEIVAFNMVHRSGTEGWMGPLAVRQDLQGSGVGKEIVRRGVEWLKDAGARVIGLETMPRTLDNIGFYSSLGFVPGRLTLTTTLEAAHAAHPPRLFGRLSAAEKEHALLECRVLLDGLLPGYDHTREIELTDQMALGDTVLLRERDALVGFALCHTVPLVEGRTREELRVLKLALADESHLDAMLATLRDFARRCGTRRVAIRMQGEYAAAYQRLVALGGRVRWSDLRMALGGYEERMPGRGIVLSNWEI